MLSLDKKAKVICGDALKVLEIMPKAYFDAIITDPPYSSGGAMLADKQQSTSSKYTSTKTNCLMPDFEGDALDQRSWTRWMAEAFRLARACSKPGAVLCAFTDWRQLPAMSDAIQWAGWLWRGILPWDKKNARPQPGRFRQQAEFIVWASNGKLSVKRPVPVLPGAFSVAPPTQANRYHQTEKPVELMRQLVRICVPGGTILDPFCGSGSTLHAALLEGYQSVGIECVQHYAQTAQQRLDDLMK